MNSVNLIGRLTRDPELRSLPDGTSVCSMRVAVDRRDRDKDPVYVDVTSFGPGAEACARYLEKGRQIAVDGRLEFSEWEDKEGNKRSKHEVVGNVEFLGGGQRSEDADSSDFEPVPAGVGAADDDIPF